VQGKVVLPFVTFWGLLFFSILRSLSGIFFFWTLTREFRPSPSFLSMISHGACDRPRPLCRGQPRRAHTHCSTSALLLLGQLRLPPTPQLQLP